MTAVIDYGVGNLFSLCGSLAHLGADVCITADPKVIESADHIILPGVGAFGDAIQKLKESNLIPCIERCVAKGTPLLGICLGMQLLFEKSYEYGEYEGLGFIKGEITPLKEVLPDTFKVPHMGWNSLTFLQENPLFKYVEEGEYVYYVHSFFGTKCKENTLATSSYGGVEVTGAVAKGNIFGTQFHPEKSGDTGLRILKAFLEV